MDRREMIRRAVCSSFSSFSRYSGGHLEIADDEGRTYEAIKKRMERIRAQIRDEILECLEMNCRGGK